ncbi:MAG: 3-methyl-2-oxobutanoate hydroxymethyltransferase [Planctomycetota bacterium]
MPTPHDTPPSRPAVTLKTLRRMAESAEPFACLTCYDATTARWLEAAGVHVLLVGDTAAEVVLGHPSTVHMPLDFAITLTAGVKRGAPNTVVMGDMPFMSYQADDAEAIRNAGRFVTEGLADVVKLEADASFAPLVAKMARAGIPVCGHVGSRPQSVGLTGGYASAGRTADAAERVIEDAAALEEAGAVMLLVEAVPEEVTTAILERTSVPLIGIGAGPAPHGQILVLQDLIGMTHWQPGFARPVAHVGPEIQKAVETWVRRVGDRTSTDHRYLMKRGESAKFKSAAPE